jgi:hypothetical protein
MSSNTNRWDTTSSEVGATERILQSVLAALNEGKLRLRIGLTTISPSPTTRSNSSFSDKGALDRISSEIA